PRQLFRPQEQASASREGRPGSLPRRGRLQGVRRQRPGSVRSRVEERTGSGAAGAVESRMDIATTADIRTLVDRFYEKVNRDALLAPIFNEVAGVDWPSHLATLYTFWETLLLGSGTYQGAPFPKHSVLPVEKAHFDRWLELFLATVDEN